MRRQERTPAQSIVEFAIVVPMFLLLLFGLIDFSRLLFTYISLSNGTREMARTAAVSQSWNTSSSATSNSAIGAFKNYTVIAGGQNSATDSVTILVGSPACAHTEDTGGTCSGSSAPTQVVCTLPLSTASCTLPQPQPGGFVEVQGTYTFQFNPLFQTRLDGVTDVWFMRPTALLTTTARSYVE